jgi:hypothetical protein
MQLVRVIVARTKVKRKQAKHSAKKRLLTALRSDLTAIERSPHVRSLAEGKDYVCTVCEMPTKPCESDPSAVCGHMVREGTDSWLVERSLQEPEAHPTGNCLSCGKRIAPAQLKKNPLAELCALCIKSSERVQVPHSARA